MASGIETSNKKKKNQNGTQRKWTKKKQTKITNAARIQITLKIKVNNTIQKSTDCYDILFFFFHF